MHQPPILRMTLCVSLLLAACASTRSTPSPSPVSDPHGASPETAAPSPSPTPATASPRPTVTLSPAITPAVQLMAVGDVMLARSIGARMLADGPRVPFAAVASILNDADLLAANLECTISQRGEPQPKAYTFRAPPVAAEALALAGVDVVSQANNHALDYGDEALMDTLGILADHHIVVVGAGPNDAAARAPAVLERNGLRIAFLAYVDVPVESRSGFDTRQWAATGDKPGVAWADLDPMATEVSAARTQADAVVVLLHFGFEGRTEPSPAQRAEAHAAIDAGAALVLGSHPHILQRAEEYHGGLIVYSLGNFVFDGFGFPANASAIFTATLTRDGVGEYDWIPVIVEEGLPRLATPEEAPVVLARVQPVP